MTAWVLAAAMVLAGQSEADSDRARRLYFQALDQTAELNLDSTLVLLGAARDADLSNLSIHLDYIEHALRWTSGGLRRLRQEYAELPDSPVVRCLRVYLEAYPPDAVPALLEMEERGDGAGCPTVVLPGIFGEMRPSRLWDVRRLEYYPRALTIAPEVMSLWTRYGETLASLGRLLEAEEAFGEAGVLAHPTQRVRLNMRRAGVALLRGDTSAAVALRRAVATAVDRDGRPGLRLIYLRELDGWPLRAWEEGSGNSGEDLVSRQADFARVHHAWNYEWQARYTLGMRSSDRGEPMLAVQELSRAIAIADSVGVSALQAQTYKKRGRALGRLGRWEAAEKDLLLAVELAQDSGLPYEIADAWHNLYQMYYDAGRLEDALRAGDSFLDTAEALSHSPLRWAANLAAGEIRWKLGWHAAANEAFARSISVIDEFEEGHNYAGEYFERQGDLERAKEYFTQGTVAYGGWAESVRGLSWAGLARVYLELGQVDRARAAAVAHDAEIKNERSVPLLPWILAEEGRVKEAVEISAGWAQTRLEAGSLAGAAVANLQRAELSLEARDPEGALAAANRADSLGLVVDLVDESIQAGRLRGLALAALGDTARALDVLQSASIRAGTTATAATLLSMDVAFGDLLAAHGRTDEALASYQKAAGRVLETTAGFEMDLDRVRYRDRHLNPYDGGVLALLRASGRADRIPELALWSQRRKAAALRVALASPPDEEGSEGLLSVGEIQSRLRDMDAVVDFQEVGDSVWALVVRKESVVLRKLPIASDSLAAMARSLINPFSQVYGGRLDLARARFDEVLSHGLYRALWEPFSDGLTGVSRVFLVPDGGLHLVPFAALVTEDPEEGGGPGSAGPRYLLDGYEIIHLSSLRFLPKLDNFGTLDPASTRILAVEGDAPGAEDEVSGIEDIWGRGAVRVLSGAEATETNILATGDRYGILHFAVHAFADDRDPLASYLRLSPDSGSDGLLHLVEIARIPDGRRLVVLSACETQAGRSFQGEGLMGLSRAFLVAGAEAVVASNWLVGGQASQFMGDLYRQIADGSSLAAALRFAQLEARARPETSHPFFWAGFVLHLGGN
ncbi:MAG: CHAT domain-containing protein [Gemmatimonadota bacterium]